MAVKLSVHPAFFRRLRHYRDRISRIDGRPQVAFRLVKQTEAAISNLLENPLRGHAAGFEAADLADILRVSIPGFSVFALFYRWDGQALTVITVEHSAQDLPSRLAGLLSKS